MATAHAYAKFQDHLANARVDLDTDTIKVMLTTSSYTPNQNTHDFRDDATNEVSGTGYTAGGVTLTNKALTTTGPVEKFDADDVSWPNSTITARYAVLYKSRGGASSADELIGYVDFGGDFQSSAGLFAITWDAAGILTLTVP